jgi:hypothetical protein
LKKHWLLDNEGSQNEGLWKSPKSIAHFAGVILPVSKDILDETFRSQIWFMGGGQPGMKGLLAEQPSLLKQKNNLGAILGLE